MKNILVVSSIWGHESIAKGVNEALLKKYDSKFELLEIDEFSKKSYALVYRYFPQFFKIAFLLSGNKLVKKLANKHFEKAYKYELERLIKKHHPNLVVSSYFAFNTSLDHLIEKYDFKYINVISDPWTFSSISVAKQGDNLVFDKYSNHKLKSYTKKSGWPVGWFVENRFYKVQKKSRDQVRKELGLNPRRFTICVTSGSDGSFGVLKVLNTFINSKYNIQILFMCGNNEYLLKMVEGLSMISKKVKGPNIIAVPYTNQIHLYFRASNIVIGKAGPNTLFESVATLTPFFAISHIWGQEDGNLEIIKKYKLGFVEENPLFVIKKLKEIFKNPKLLEKFNPSLNKMSNYCEQSKEKLLEHLEANPKN